MKVEEFLNPNSMLTPGVLGSTIMMLTNTINFNFGLPNKWVGLALSFTVGLLIMIKLVLPLWQRLIYYVINSLIIFSMAVGASAIGERASSPPPPKSASAGQLQPTVAAAPSADPVSAIAGNCSAEAAADSPCS